MSAFNSVRFVRQFVVPRQWQGKFVLVLAGYIDGSNLHKTGVDIISVAGCATDTDKWEIWEKKWEELLKFSDLPRWHHTDFVSKIYRKPGQPDRNWREAEWLFARNLLCEAFEEIRPAFVGATVRQSDYQELKIKYPSLPDDPYYFLLDRCLHRLIQGMFKYPKDDGIVIYCDQDKEESLVQELSKWHTEYLRATANHHHPEDSFRPVVTSYGSNIKYIPLQAADVFAHELMNFSRNNPEMPFIATNIPTGSYILERLKSGSLSFAMCLPKNWLESELDGSAWELGHPQGYRFAPPPDVEG